MSESEKQADGNDTTFYYAIIGTLLMMSLSLAGLWLLQKKKTNQALATNAKLIQDITKEQQRLQKTFKGLVGGAFINRDSLPVVQHVIDGKPRNVLEIDYGRAMMIGLRQDDVLWVNPALNSQPFSAPASMPGNMPEAQ